MASMTNGKVDYEPWLRWREQIDILREKYGWRELSTLHGKSERGYISQAYEHRSILEPSVIKITEELVAKELKEREQDGAGADLDNGNDEETDQEQRLAFTRNLAGAFRDELGLTWAEASEAFGYAAGSLASMIRREDAASWDAIKQAQSKLQHYREFGVPTKEAEPETAAAPTKAWQEETDPWAWLDSVQASLVTLAARVEAEGQRVPPAFRGPYEAKAKALLDLAEKEFQR